MVKKYLITLAIALALIPLIILLTFQSTFNYKNILDSSFVVGIAFLSVGLIMVTGAGKVFSGIGFLAKKLVGKKYLHYTYFEYIIEQNELKDKKKGFSGAPIFIVGILLFATSLILSFYYL